MSGHMHDSVIHLQPFRVFGEGAGKHFFTQKRVSRWPSRGPFLKAGSSACLLCLPADVLRLPSNECFQKNDAYVKMDANGKEIAECGTGNCS
jgi:hypothetical protein